MEALADRLNGERRRIFAAEIRRAGQRAIG
jgi:hypothetical protein